jgi:hypothetical protein
VTEAAHRLRAALAAVLIQAEAPELALVHRWLDNWRGVGLLVEGLHRVGYDVHLTQYGDNTFRATFYITGIAHSIVAAARGSLRPGVPCSGRGGTLCNTPSVIYDGARVFGSCW